ncbi:MAG: FkbM family methyltransferase [Rhodospirillales bacterium]
MKRQILNLLVGLLHAMARGLDRLIQLLTGRRQMLQSGLAERLAPVHEQTSRHGTIRLATPSEACLMRAETLFTKEPDMIDWVDGFPDGFVFWDIGANVGIYSVYAGLKGGGQIFSFEPESANYWVLNRNIHLNGLDENCTAYCLPLSDRTGVTRLALHTTMIGDALHNLAGVDGLVDDASVHHQGAVTITADEAISTLGIPAPTHLKIDVDGAEALIIRGAGNLLRNPALQSILVELDDIAVNPGKEVADALAGAGFVIASSQASPIATGRFAAIRNYIYVRGDAVPPTDT